MQADHFGLLSNVFGLYLEGTPATPFHQTRLPCSRPVRPTLCLRDINSHFSKCQVPGGIPYEMPTQNSDNLVEAIRSQLGNICAHWSICMPPTTSSDIVASPSLATSPDCRTAPQHIKPYSLTSTSHSVVFTIPPGVVSLVAHVADGLTKSETTPARHLPTSGDRPLDAVIMDDRRDGPRWLCDDDDDDDDDDSLRVRYSY